MRLTRAAGDNGCKLYDRRTRVFDPRGLRFLGLCFLWAALAMIAGAGWGQNPPGPAALVLPGSPSAADPRMEKELMDARALLSQGKIEEGLQKLRETQKAHPEDVRVLFMLGSALEGSDHREQAKQLYREAADHMPDPGPALSSLERLCRQDQDWDHALAICLEVLQRKGDQGAGWVADELESLIRGDKVGSEAVKSLEGAIQKHPEDRRLRQLLMQVFLHLGRTDRALDEASSLDRSTQAHGREIYALACLAEEKGDPKTALDGFERIQSAEPSAELKESALLGKARALRKLRKTQESLQALDAVIASCTGKTLTNARLTKAEILDTELKRSEEALELYRQALAGLEQTGDREAGHERDDVRLSMADCQLRLGRPSDAAQTYQELSTTAADADVRAQAMYQAGEMLLYQGKLKEAEDAYYQLTEKCAGSTWVNNALERILVLGEDTDAGGLPVVALAQAQYQERLGASEKGLKLLQEAYEQNPACRAAPRLLAEKVRILLDLGRVDEGAVAADSLAARFPASPLAPRALLSLAENLSQAPGGEAKGMAVCMEILTKFPDSPEAPAARTILARSRDRGKSGSNS